MPSFPNVVVYGLSTEGYNLASSLVSAGHKVSLLDESTKMGFSLNADIIRTYSSASDLIEDESLLELDGMDDVIASASYLFFFPKIRKIGQEVKIDVSSKFIDAIKPIKNNTSIIYTLPTGIGGNEENIDILEHTTGMTVGENIYYYYMPVNSGPILSTNTILGNFNSKRDIFLENMLKKFTHQEINFVNILSAELAYVSRILRHYSGIASVLEVCKFSSEYGIDNQIIDNFYKDLYLDDITNGLHDLRIIQSSLHGSNPLVYLVNGTIKSIEGYTKNLIDKVRYILKKRNLKASKTRISISWTLDTNEMRGDKIDVFALLESKLRDYIGEVERKGTNSLDTYPSDKTTISIACSKNDYRLLSSQNKSSESIIIKANPICEVV
ncbi:MAG TPA: hypothetical protein VFP49_04090 [Nitrososphaeraceae archaeon]|nr:hypothetical protein [Nitrososphaeraceae archaeon]